MRRLKNIEGKNEEQLKEIEYQGEKTIRYDWSARMKIVKWNRKTRRVTKNNEKNLANQPTNKKDWKGRKIRKDYVVKKQLK